MGKHKLMMVVLTVLIVCFMLACMGKTKVEFKSKQIVNPTVTGLGYAWGKDAEKNAREAAIFEATAQCDPRSIMFDYLRVDGYTMFKMNKNGSCDINITNTEKLPGGGFKVTAEALRSSEAVKDMRFMTTVNFTLNCKGETLKERATKCNAMIYEKSLTSFAEKKYGTVPEKMKGNFTFFLIDKQDDGKKMTANVSAFVGLAQGKLSKEEKSMVLMNAWRSSCKNGVGADGIFYKAYKLTPNANYAEEFALSKIKKKDWKTARKVIKRAIKMSPYESRYLKILYKIEQEDGDELAMEKVQKKLEEMKAWEQDSGADITSTLHYSTSVRWEEGGTEDTTGTVMFRQATDEDDE